MEQWKSVPQYEGLYEVSEYGRVRSLDRVVNCKLGKRTIKGKILSQRTTPFGYKEVGLGNNGNAKTHKVHRLVALAFLTNPESKLFVNHIDGNKVNNLLTNLEFVTASENSKHAVETGLQSIPKNENAHRALFTNKQVISMRELYKHGITISQLCKLHSAKYMTIYCIVRGQSYRSL